MGEGLQRAAAAARATRKRKVRLSDEERHCIGHAQYLVDQATDETPDVFFDYEVVRTLLKLLERLGATCR